MTETRTISSDLAQYLWELGDGDFTTTEWCTGEEVGWRRLEEIEGDHGRWHRHMTLIVESPDGRNWEMGYALGLTENQEHELPWRDASTVEIHRVYRKAIVTYTWVTRNPEETT